jgi:hypothetical protein
MALARVFDGERTQSELRRHFIELRRCRLEHGNADQAAGSGEIIIDLRHCNVGERFAILVGNAIDTH